MKLFFVLACAILLAIPLVSAQTAPPVLSVPVVNVKAGTQDFEFKARVTAHQNGTYMVRVDPRAGFTFEQDSQKSDMVRGDSVVFPFKVHSADASKLGTFVFRFTVIQDFQATQSVESSASIGETSSTASAGAPSPAMPILIFVLFVAAVLHVKRKQ